MTRHEPVVLSRAKSATFISVILQNNKNTVQLHFGCTVFFEFTDNAVQSCSCTALPNKRAAIHCTISLSLASSGWHSKTRGLRHLKNFSPCEGFANLLADRFTVYAVFGCYAQHQFLFTQNLSSFLIRPGSPAVLLERRLSDGW